jgi:hypothetical protein
MTQRTFPAKLPTGEPDYRLGDLVWESDPAHNGLFQVWALMLAWHSTHRQMEVMYFCRKMDTQTGQLLVCLDSRCSGANRLPLYREHCPICSGYFFADRIKPMTRHDADFYVGEGMLHRDLAKHAKGKHSG